MTNKLTVALLFGGRSSEHSISCATAGGVLAAIDRDRYHVIPVGITRDGAFVLEADDPARFTLDADELPEVFDNGTRIRWPESSLSRQLTVSDGAGYRSLGNVDLVFPILHGPFGEDGTVQGLLELVGLPYVGSGVLASALGMDKHFTKTVFQQAALPVAPWRTITAGDWAEAPGMAFAAAEELGLPVFVKPARAGSSVGVSRVSTLDQLAEAMRVALLEDSKVLIEAGLRGRELEIAVLQGRPGEPTRASVAGEVRVTGRDFYDFAAKYLGASGIDLVCPADLTSEELAQMQALAIRAFDAIDGAGLARVDFFLTDDGWVINEINTMPGFTPISMFPSCWLASGFTYPQLIDELIEVAIAHRAAPAALHLAV
ncbi:D-alanine--D-alanine ligase [Cryobacterium sp. TMT1-62]|uniref:D-alanine--D-alanine ligase n=1 Tax=Cryobacterium sandaracinum TaxID=1259247 RepID=A0ABY2JMG1_9MICO|nr:MULTISPECIES: D-alanine--D-alanine ligase family protein [Cryobacterium]TFB58224.1 D-alanine--D-alanine ligase [Cryobacterium sp. Sr3]TFB58753.1 D-alanine--D-alanine ligase [Cryobacterium sp. Hz7]TFC51514.1 D-alanine--D-alanine ligase [Cryobacterium sp. TMT2-17-1]TFC71725.1 D-alanine--D-alanine ligase [Cryobacterium sp. TMT2-4]TFD06741.1 D-alanine--D-alanine ligase [Cryobacterium sandaracinum]